MPAVDKSGRPGAAVDYFLKIGGIPGESEDSKHKEEIQLEAWSWGETNSGSMAEGGGGGAGKVSMMDFTFTMKANKASPKLFKACATGEHIPKAVLSARKTGTKGDDFYKYTFTDLIISSYQTGGSGGDLIPLESIAFNFAAIEVEYKPQKPDGTLGGAVKAGFNQKNQEAS
jgi:type VI secretion system secreted protein Hcp